MGSQSDTVTVQVELRRDEYERVMAQARKERRPVGQVIPALIEDGLQSRMSVREIMERVSAEYRAQLAASGEPELSADELLEKLRRDREEIVNELDP